MLEGRLLSFDGHDATAGRPRKREQVAIGAVIGGILKSGREQPHERMY